MPLYNRRRSPFIWVRGSVAGEKYRRSSGVRKDADNATLKAEEYEHTLRERLWRKHKLGDRGAISVREAAQRWVATLTNKTAHEDRAKVEWFLTVPALAEASVNDIDLEVLEELQGLMTELGRAPGTVDKYMGVMRRFLRWSKERKYLTTVPKVPMFSLALEEARYLTPDEYATLYEYLPDHMQAPAHFAVHTGLREGALLSLKWRNVDRQNRRAWIEARFMKAKKGKAKPHGFPLSDEALAALNLAEANRKEQERLYLENCRRKGLKPEPGDTEHVFTYRRVRISNCNTRAFRQALRQAGITNADWHTFRHTFASWAVQGGVTLQELMKLGPWESYQMVLRYSHLAPDGLSQAVTRVAQMGHTAKLRQPEKVKKSA